MRNALKVAAVLLLLLVTMGNQGCDFTSPEHVAQSTADAMAPYFPNVRVTANPQTQKVIAYTCMSGAGPKLIGEIYNSMLTNPSLGKFNQLRIIGALTGKQTYRFFALGFERALIVYNVDEKTLYRQDSDSPAWAQEYAQACGGATE